MNGWEFADNNPIIALMCIFGICWAFANAVGGLRKPADGPLVNFLRLAVIVVPTLLKLLAVSAKNQTTKKET